MNILKKILDNNAISENIVVTEISGLVRSWSGALHKSTHLQEESPIRTSERLELRRSV